MAEGKTGRIWDRRVILQQWCNTCEVVVVSTWRQAGSLPLLAILGSVFQRRTLCHQWPAGTAELERVVVGCWIKRQSVESWKTQATHRATFSKWSDGSWPKGGNAVKHEKEKATWGPGASVLFMSKNPVGFVRTHITADLINTFTSMALMTVDLMEPWKRRSGFNRSKFEKIKTLLDELKFYTKVHLLKIMQCDQKL